MRYISVLFLALILALIFIRVADPAKWNQCINYLKTSDEPVRSADQPAAATPAPGPESLPVTASASSNPPGTEAGANPLKTFVAPNPFPKRPNWVWKVSGNDYTNVVVQKVEADCVTITHSQGGARLDIAQLDPEIQKLLNYDPDLAAQAAAKRKDDEAASTMLLDQEKNQADILRKQRIEEQETARVQAEAKEKEELEAMDARGRVDQAKKMMADYQEDLRHLSTSYLTTDPRTGVLVGDAYSMRKYQEDLDGIAACQKVIDAKGKIPTSSP